MEPSETAAALNRINDQLAIQNRRRSRIWKVVAWGLGLFAAFHVVLLALGYALYADPASLQTETGTQIIETME